MRASIHVIAVLLLAVVSTSIASGQDHPSDQRRLNVLLIVADDLGWRDLGCFGSTFYETPNIDALAARGMKLMSAYAAPVCSPTRASLLTGKYPQRVGVTDFISRTANGSYSTKKNGYVTPRCKDRLALEEVTLAEALREAGYATFFAGKWHLGPEGFWPEDQGFDINKGGWTAGHPSRGGKYFSPWDNPRLTDGPPGEHLDDRLSRETVDFLRKQQAAGKPFFAEFALYSVHTPIMAPQDLVKKYEAKIEQLKLSEAQFGSEGKQKVRLTQNHATYAAMVEVMDRAVGQVTKALDELKLADNTIVVFMSDNGGLSTAEGTPTSNVPLRAGKGWLYEGGVRVPAIVAWPGRVKPGSASDAPVSATDWYPTLLEAANLPPRPQQHVDGVSVVPLLDGKTFTHGPIYWHYPHFGNQGGFPGGAVRDGDFKLVQNFITGKVELFDLSKDLAETTDLSEKMPEKTEQLLSALNRWQKDLHAVFPVKENE
jgi:arylsulfatase A-like enzyme